MVQTYYVIGYSEDCGKTFAGKPKVVDSTELAHERDNTAEATGGNWDVIVIHEFNVTHEENDSVEIIGDTVVDRNESEEDEDIPF